ncbi:hypothetical protein C8Q80DRAFT_1189460 [Daedaleopsis nitida]|nr:hypothetical protein C8Q80DRAFT_1189460 [Daedaleopsis nitida]
MSLIGTPGQEVSYIIISTMRILSAGFLNSLTPMNVMLSHCKARLDIVIQRGSYMIPPEANAPSSDSSQSTRRAVLSAWAET